MAGTLYVKECTRAKVPSGIIKAYDLDVKIASADETFKKQFPLAKFPSYLGEKGFKLTETVAISIYCMYFIFSAFPAYPEFCCGLLYSFIRMRNLFNLYSYPCLKRSCREFII